MREPRTNCQLEFLIARAPLIAEREPRHECRETRANPHFSRAMQQGSGGRFIERQLILIYDQNRGNHRAKTPIYDHCLINHAESNSSARFLIAEPVPNHADSSRVESLRPRS